MARKSVIVNELCSEKCGVEMASELHFSNK